VLSYKNIIEGTFDPELVKHKVVLVGMTATGDLDTWATPVSPAKVPGVWIHANTIDTILRERFLIEIGLLPNLLILLLLTLIAGAVLPRLNLKYSGMVTAGLIIIYLIGVFYAFDHGYILKILYPVLLLPLLFVTAVFCTVLYEQSDKRLIKNLFGRYVSPQVANEIISLTDTGRLRLGGELRTVTVLFADIRGFTHMSESMSPTDVVAMLNKYLGILIDKVLEYDGMVNKFAGDCIMAVWNAPQTQSDHAFLAVKAAYESQQLIARERKMMHLRWQ
jgi:adenylate cyclase